MKKLLVTLMCCFLTACATGSSPFAPPVRTVKDNVFYSDKNPKITINVDSRLKYMGKHAKSYNQSWPDWSAGVKQTVYLFAGLSEGYVDRSFAVSFKEIDEGHWLSRCMGLTSRYVELAGKKYCFSDHPSTGRKAFGFFRDYVYANKWNLFPYYIVRNMRLRQDRNKVDFNLYYFEKVSKDIFSKFRIYLASKGAPMPNELSEYLKLFDERCKNSFNIATEFYN